MFLSDTGSSNALYGIESQDGLNHWNGGDLSALGNLHLTDFEVLTLPAVHNGCLGTSGTRYYVSRNPRRVLPKSHGSWQSGPRVVAASSSSLSSTRPRRAPRATARAPLRARLPRLAMTSPSSPASHRFLDGVVGAGYQERDRSEQRDHAIAVRRVWTYASPRLRAIDRLLNWFSVAAGAIAHIAFRREPVDVVFVSTPPITLGLAALAAAARWRARLVVDVRDVYPDVAIKMGVWKKNSVVARLVGALADALYRRASPSSP